MALGNPYIFTRHDVTSYFWAAANCIYVFIFGVMFGSRFLNNASTDSENFTVWETVIQLRFSYYSSLHYINGWCLIVVMVHLPMRVIARSCMNVFRTSNSKYYR